MSHDLSFMLTLGTKMSLNKNGLITPRLFATTSMIKTPTFYTLMNQASILGGHKRRRFRTKMKR